MAKKIDKEQERAALVNFRRFAPEILKTIKKSGAAKFTPEESDSMRFVGAYLARDAVHRAGTGRKPGSDKSTSVSRPPEDFSLFAKLAAQSTRCFALKSDG